MKVKTAVFPVGGLGTRFLPVTKSMPKEMLPVACKPLIQYVFEEAMMAGIERFVFITGRNKNAINNHFDHSYELQHVLSAADKASELSQVRNWLPEAGRIAFVRQQEPLGLGHAVWCARHFVGHEPFAVLLADEMIVDGSGFLSRMMRAHATCSQPTNMIALDVVPREQSSRYGMVSTATSHQEAYIKETRISAGSITPLDRGRSEETVVVTGMVEKPDPQESPSCSAIVGRYILSPRIFDHLACTKPGRGGEIQLTDAMRSLLDHEPFQGIYCPGARFDCGSPLGFLEANIAYGLQQPEMKQPLQALLSRYAK